jgi:imidazole glycerol-phosphate synthase subunit HisF
MPLAKRIIPCLDVDNGRVVKGVHFTKVKDAGDPVEFAEKYSQQGADEPIFGRQCIVIAIDAKRNYCVGGKNFFKSDDGKEKYWFEVRIYGGKEGTGIDAIEWAKRAESLGAGEILLTSIDADGTENGYDIKLNKAICLTSRIPIIASGGCGHPEHMLDVFKNTEVDAALAASIFHYEKSSVDKVKEYLNTNGIKIRM